MLTLSKYFSPKHQLLLVFAEKLQKLAKNCKNCKNCQNPKNCQKLGPKTPRSHSHLGSSARQSKNCVFRCARKQAKNAL